MTSERDRAAAARAGGPILTASSLLFVALITNHPTAGSGLFLHQGIHGLLMLMILTMTAGFLLFVLWRRSLLAAIGLVPFAAGAIAAFGAGTINGFIAPSLVTQGIASYGDLLWTSNQVLASIGIVATAAAFSLWSLDLWRLGWRITAALGLLAGMLPAMLLLSGRIDMHITGAMIAYSANAIWALWLGVVLIRKAFKREERQ